MEYKYVLKKNLNFDEVEKRFRDAIEDVGLKVVGEVMPSMKIKKMLGMEIPPYKVLFICHPKYIYDMMQMDYDIGILVPCHGVIYERNGEIFVGVDLPTTKLKLSDEKIAKYIRDVEERMKKAVDMV